MKKTLFTLIFFCVGSSLHSAQEDNSLSNTVFSTSPSVSTENTSDGDNTSERRWSPSLELEENEDSDDKGYDLYDFEEFSPQTRTTLEKFWQRLDREDSGKKNTKFQSQSSRNQRDEATIKHEKRKPSAQRTINPFEVTTPDLLGKHQLGKKTNSHLVPVHGKKEAKGAFHSESSKREAAFERGQISSAGRKFSSNEKLAVLNLVMITTTGQLR